MAVLEHRLYRLYFPGCSTAYHTASGPEKITEIGYTPWWGGSPSAELKMVPRCQKPDEAGTGTVTVCQTLQFLGEI